MTFGDERFELCLGVLLVDDLILNIGPVETGHESRCAIECQLLYNLAPGEIIRRRGQRDAGNLGKALSKHR